MTRMVALLIVLGIVGAQAASLTCDLLCAAPAAAGHSADGCHAQADQAAGLRLTAVPSRCDHGGLGPWLVEVGQQAPRSAIEAVVQSTDGAVTSELSLGSVHSPWLLLEAPPPLGRARSSILRI